MLQFKRWLITIVSLLSLVAILGFIKFTQIKAAIAFGESFPEPSETVNAVVSQLSEWQPEIEVIGEIRATQTLTLRNELEGIITQVGFASGAKVSKGDVLIQLDIRAETAQLEAIQAQIELARLDVKRFEDLLSVNAGSREQYDRAIAQLAVLQANARALQATITKKTLITPFDATAAIHEWEVGTFVAANTEITTLIGDTHRVWVDFSLPQRYASIEQGQQVKVRTDATPIGAVSAQVTATNQQISDVSRSLRVRAVMDNRDAQLKPGAFVKVQVPTGSAKPVFELPNTALRYDTFGSFVYVLEPQGGEGYRAKRRSVEVLSRTEDMAMIGEGLEVGELIATIGASKLLPDMLVYVAE